MRPVRFEMCFPFYTKATGVEYISDVNNLAKCKVKKNRIATKLSNKCLVKTCIFFIIYCFS